MTFAWSFNNIIIGYTEGKESKKNFYMVSIIRVQKEESYSFFFLIEPLYIHIYFFFYLRVVRGIEKL